MNMMILDYHDACIYPQDLELVEKENQWLNDSVIHFYFTYLQQQHRRLTTTMTTTTSPRASSNEATKKRSMRPGSSPCLFMDPSAVSFWMHQCTDQDDLDGFKAGIPFPLTPSMSVSPDDNDNSNEGRFDDDDDDDVDGYILVPINDNHAKSSDWTRPGSGMHWSLLLVCVSKKKRQTKSMDEKDDKTQPDHNKSSFYPSSSSSSSSGVAVKFYHFDSSKFSGNIRAAQDVAQQFYDDIYCHSPFREGHGSSVKVVPLPTPQQTNGYDCGVHVLGAADVFLSLLTGASGGAVSSDVNDNDGFTMVDLFCKELANIFGSDPGRYCQYLRNEVATLIRRLGSKESTPSKHS